MFSSENEIAIVVTRQVLKGLFSARKLISNAVVVSVCLFAFQNVGHDVCVVTSTSTGVTLAGVRRDTE